MRLGIVMLIGAGYLSIRLVGFMSVPRGTNAAEPTGAGHVSKVAAKVLLLHSYHRGYPWVDAITRGVRMALSDADVDLQIVYMDTKRHTDETFKQRAGESVKSVVAEWKPDVIIVADDNAQRYFAESYMGRDDVQIVGCGINAKPETYGYPATNATAILERPHFRQTMAMLHRLVPQARRIGVLSDDSPTSRGALQFMDDTSLDCRIVSREMVATFGEWKDAVRRLETTADAIAIYMYHTLKSADSTESLEPTSVVRWTMDNSSLPVVGFFIFAVDDGALCGYLESGVEHGMRAGAIALEILAGKTAGQIETVTVLEGQSMLNLKTAQKLGLTIPDSVIADVAVLVEN